MMKLLRWLSLIFLLIFARCGGKHFSSNVEKDDTSYIARLNKLIEQNPRIDSLYYDRALYWLSQKDFPKALTDIRKAIEISPSKVRNHLLLADIYLASGNISNSRSTLIKAMELDKDNVEPLLKLAELALFEKDYKSVEMYCKSVLDKDKFNGRAEFIWGYSLLEQGDTVNAIKHIKKATLNDPENYDAFEMLGVVLFKRKDPTAGEYFRTAVQLRPASIEALYNYGLWLQENLYFDEALKQYDAILTINPKNKYAWFNQGYIHLVYLKNYSRAVELFTRALEIDSTYTDALYNRGLSYEMMGDKTRARQDYKRVLKQKENHPDAIKRLNALDK